MVTANQLISHLGLEQLDIEGGLFKQTYCSDEMLPAGVLPKRYDGSRSMSTAIYYLLTSEPDSFSSLHRLTTDEVYHFYYGDPVEMLLLHPEGRSERVTLGQDILAGQHVQWVVPQGVWQGSHLLTGGRFALMGTTMAPGFDPKDFALGDRQELTQLFPEQAELIQQLTRVSI